MSGVSEFGKDIGLVHEAVVTSRKAGWGQTEWAKLAHDVELMRTLRQVIQGRAEVVAIFHVIDCDAIPFIPEGWSVEEHQKGGQVVWNPDGFDLWLSLKQQNGKFIEGHKLRKELANQAVLNANVLDYFLENLHLIPETWKGKALFFWGTIYRSPDGFACVRYLYWGGGRWYWDAYWLVNVWDGGSPALVSRK